MSKVPDNADRLEEKALGALTLPTPERIQFIKKDTWVPYTRATEAIGMLDDLLVYPRSVRMPCHLLVGDSDNGKSTVFERFANDLHPMTMLPGGDPYMPVVYMVMPAVPTPNNFWTELLGALPAASQVTDSILLKERQAKDLASFIKVKMVLVDQMNNIIQATYKDQRKILAILRDLSTTWKIPVGVAGTHEMINAMRTDPQLHTRFEVSSLPVWTLDSEEYWRFLLSYERLLPLAKPSNLANPAKPQLAVQIHAMSGGTVGGIVRILKKAAVHAISSRKECIDAKVLDTVKETHLKDYA